MSRKFKVWLDSCANAYSRREEEITLDYLGISDSEWDAMTEDQREDAMRDIAFARSDWGYVEIKEGGK